MIIDDLTAGTNLPEDMDQMGRFNKTVCQVFLAKAYMQMYRDYGSAPDPARLQLKMDQTLPVRKPDLWTTTEISLTLR